MPPQKGKVPASLTVDFSNVEERREGSGKAFRGPEGDYLLKVMAVELRSKKGDESSKYLAWKFAPHAPEKYQGKGFVWHNTTLKPEGLWSLRNLIEDFGIKVPKSAIKLPLAEIVKRGLIIGATLEDDEYEGKIKSKIAATFKKKDYEETAEEETEEEDEEEESTEAIAEDDEELEELEMDEL